MKNAIYGWTVLLLHSSSLNWSHLFPSAIECRAPWLCWCLIHIWVWEIVIHLKVKLYLSGIRIVSVLILHGLQPSFNSEISLFNRSDTCILPEGDSYISIGKGDLQPVETSIVSVHEFNTQPIRHIMNCQTQLLLTLNSVGNVKFSCTMLVSNCIIFVKTADPRFHVFITRPYTNQFAFVHAHWLFYVICG